MSDVHTNRYSGKLSPTITSVPEHLSSLLHHRKAAIHLVHGDMYHDVGGIERFVKESCRYAHEELALSSIVIAPCEVKGILLYTVWLDEQLAFSLSVDTIVWALRKLVSDRQVTFSSCNLHNALFWDLADLLVLVKEVKSFGTKLNAYVHDFNYICEQQNLFYNGLKFCGAPTDTSSGLCKSCQHGRTVSTRREGLRRILNHCNAIVSPSETSRDIFLKVYPELATSMRIEPHLVIERTNTETKFIQPGQGDDQKIAVVYMGVPSVGKGINRYSELINSFKDQFRWITIGVEDYFDDSATVEHIIYNHHKQHDLSETLTNLKPCVVFLGSIIPETFSYTVHESLRAQIPVVTTVESGNIAQVVQQFDGGRAFDSFQSMVGFFETGEVKEFVRNWGREHCYSVRMNNEGISRAYS